MYAKVQDYDRMQAAKVTIISRSERTEKKTENYLAFCVFLFKLSGKSENPFKYFLRLVWV